MDRLACVDLPALPLQLLARRDALEGERPLAVVDRNTPQGRLLWVNEAAWRRRVLPGMRYAAALSIAGDLHAGVVEEAEVERAVADLLERLRRFTPEVEPSREAPGVFWLDATGLGRLFASPRRWAEGVRTALAELGYRSTVVVGFSRFGSYALARGGRGGVVVLADPVGEERAARRVPLARLGFPTELRDALARLGIDTVGDFVALPAAGVGERFGAEAHRLHRWAAGALWTPLRPRPAAEPLAGSTELEHPDDNLDRLLFVVKRLLDPLLAELAAGQRALAGVALALTLEDGSRRRQEVRPARPTLAAAELLDLTRLALEAVRLPAGIEEVELTVEGVPATPEQLSLLAIDVRRDLAAADRALARLRAELGRAAVVRARPADRHLPEGSFLWEPLASLADVTAPLLEEPPEKVLVRRLFAKPLPLPPRPHQLRDDGWLIRGVGHGAVVRLVGPYVLSGGWWRRGVRREYHFAETRRGDLLWVFYHRGRRRWYLHGQVE